MKTFTECKYGLSIIRSDASLCPVACSVHKQSAISQSVRTLFHWLSSMQFPSSCQEQHRYPRQCQPKIHGHHGQVYNGAAAPTPPFKPIFFFSVLA